MRCGHKVWGFVWLCGGRTPVQLYPHMQAWAGRGNRMEVWVASNNTTIQWPSPTTFYECDSVSPSWFLNELFPDWKPSVFALRPSLRTGLPSHTSARFLFTLSGARQRHTWITFVFLPVMFPWVRLILTKHWCVGKWIGCFRRSWVKNFLLT